MTFVACRSTLLGIARSSGRQSRAGGVLPPGTTNLPLADVRTTRHGSCGRPTVARWRDHGGPVACSYRTLLQKKLSGGGLRVLDHDEPGFWSRTGTTTGGSWLEQRYQGDDVPEKATAPTGGGRPSGLPHRRNTRAKTIKLAPPSQLTSPVSTMWCGSLHPTGTRHRARTRWHRRPMTPARSPTVERSGNGEVSTFLHEVVDPGTSSAGTDRGWFVWRGWPRARGWGLESCHWLRCCGMPERSVAPSWSISWCRCARPTSTTATSFSGVGVTVVYETPGESTALRDVCDRRPRPS